MGAQIRLPNAAHDRPPIVLTAITTAAGLALGLAAAFVATWSTDTAPATTTSERRPRLAPTTPARPQQAVVARQAEPRATPLDENPRLAPSGTAIDEQPPDDPPPPATQPSSGTLATDAKQAGLPAPAGGAATPATPPPNEHDGSNAPASRVARVVPGRVAYVRCEGLSIQSGPYPCPRDRVLEAAIWDLLDTLRECRGARPSPDERGAELRLTFQGSAVSAAEFRAPTPDHRRFEAQLDRCLREPLQHVETKLHPTDMVVSFRFLLL